MGARGGSYMGEEELERAERETKQVWELQLPAVAPLSVNNSLLALRKIEKTGTDNYLEEKQRNNYCGLKNCENRTTGDL